MAIKVICPACGRSSTVPDSAVGKKVRCSCKFLYEVRVPTPAPPRVAPVGLETLPDTDLPPMCWDEQNTQAPLIISNDGRTLSWGSDRRERGEIYSPCWLGSQTTVRLSSGIFAWDFEIESIAHYQIGVGILLDPPDWGFFGYLGAGKNAWAYDAFEGAIVTVTEAIYAGLPTIRESGTVAVHLDLKKKHEFVFFVDGVETPAILLPKGAVVIPAACLLKKGQVVTLASFKQLQ